MGDKHLSDVIKYHKDIEPYRFVKIYSGVGSGKSTFACRFVTGYKSEKKDEEVPELTTLIITSRRAKVEETLTDMDVAIREYVGERGNLGAEVFNTGEERPEEYEKFVRIIPSNSEFCADAVTHNMSVVCTNAYIENHLRYSYVPSDPSTHLWNLFDVIIVDEVHSLITDATYQTAPFTVLEFMREYIRICSSSEEPKPQCRHLIVMTGSPEPFETCIDFPVPEGMGKEYSVFDECINVTPQKVVVLNSDAAAARLRKLLYNGEKVVYFTNHTMNKSQVMKKWHLRKEINIAVSFSSEEKRKLLSEDEIEDMEAVEDALKEGALPEDVNLFVTTSRNKEGINIKNKDIKHLFVETHFSSDVIQMVGRVREGVEFLYIVSDAEQLCKGEDHMDSDFTKRYILDDVETYGDANRHLLEVCKQNKAEEIFFNAQAEHNTFGNKYKETVGAYIKYVEKKFPYARYSFIDNCFKFYQQKADAENLIFSQTETFRNAVLMGKDDTIELVHTWFPKAEIEFWPTPAERARVYLDNLIGEKGHCELGSAELDALSVELSLILGLEREYKSTILSRVGNEYHLSKPITRYNAVKLGYKIGARVLYKGESPLDAPRHAKDPRKKTRKSK